MSFSEIMQTGDSLIISTPFLSGSFGATGEDSFWVFLVCLLALLALGESIPHRDPCPGCWEPNREGCRDACGAYRSWKRRSSGGRV